MLSSKEALEELLYYANLNFERENERKTEFSNKIEQIGIADNEESFKIIEKDLDRLERLEKAFKILANKEVNLIVLKYFIEKGDGVEAYNLYYTTKERLTKEEYELLKEALENDK